MRSRSFIVVAAALVLLLGGAAAVLAYDSGQRDQLADGIAIGGVNVGGLSVTQARGRLRAAFQARLRHPVVVRYRGRRFVLSPRAAHLRVNFESSLQAALQRTRGDDLITRVVRSLTGGSIDASFAPQVVYSAAAVSRFTVGIARVIDQPARDAAVAYSGGSVIPTQSHAGRAVRVQELQSRVQAALGRPGSPHELPIPVGVRAPKVTTAALASSYPTIITVDRSAFTLRLYKRLRLVRSYRIAVGMAGLETPAGLYHIQDKQVDPSWHVPNSAWAGSLAGQTIPPGPADPIKARWMGIYNGAGIHGTDELGSLGSAASHGCIRMAIPDVVQLYSETPLGTPVYIV
jgi:lipoprotein-anchoring transpeptidase ErfK/SrfK